MTGPTVLKRLVDTGASYAEMSQKNAEKLVSDFVKAGQVRRKDAEKMVQRLVERVSRAVAERDAGPLEPLGRGDDELDQGHADSCSSVAQ